MLTILPNVVRRGTIFHFRRAVPSHLRALFGRSELTCSLRTSDRRLAGARARELYLHWEAIFVKLGSEIPMLSDDLLAHLAQEFYATNLDSNTEARMRGARITEQVRQGRIAYWKGVAERARRDLGGNGTLYAATTTHYMLRRLNIDPKSLTQSELHQARCILLRVGIDLATAIAERYEGNFNYQPSDELLKRKIDLPSAPGEHPRTVSASDAAPSLRPALCPTLKAASAAFVSQQLAANYWDKQTAHQSQKSYELFGAVAGDKPLEAYTRQDAATFKDTLERLPADYGKAPDFRGKGPLDIIALDTERANKSERLSTRTVQRHLTALSTLWTDAISRDYVTANLFCGFKFSRQARAQDQRDMWERADLARLFATPVWSGCQSPYRRSTPGPFIIRDEKFWLPLIAVFSGLRQEEICQLQVSDIKCEQEIWYFNIDEPPRKLKNRTAVRLVPLHSELVRMGFLGHVEEQRKNKQVRVFSELKPGGADGRLGHGFTKWFSRYRQETGIYRPGLDFHSFRHSATTFMHCAGVRDSIIDRVTGHATPGETSRYTKSSDLRQLQQAVEAIALGADLERLRLA